MKLFLDVDGVILDLEKSFSSYASFKSGKLTQELSNEEWHQLWNDFLLDDAAGENIGLL